MGRRAKWGDWRIMESAEGGQFWIERFDRLPIVFSGAPSWMHYPRSRPTTYNSRAEADEALRLIIKGPTVVAGFDERGTPV